MQSTAEPFTPNEYGATLRADAGSSRRGWVVLSAVAGVAAVACVCVLLSGTSTQGQATALEGSDMKEIDGLLSHINKITRSARSGKHADSAAHQALQEKDDEDNSSAPKAVKHGMDHIGKALEEMQAAEKKMSTQGDGEHVETSADRRKKKAIIKKMKALQAQISGDFKHVTSFGNKAGFVPPVKMPHV